MTAAVDAMVLGREANARLVADTRRLYLSGSRAFAPGCVVVGDEVYVLANSDDSVPGGFPTDHLFGITWNPAKLGAALAAIPGLRDARRIAVDGMTPMMYTLLTSVAPNCELVDAEEVLRQLRVADTARQAGVHAALETARAAIVEMAGELRAEVPIRKVRGACAKAFARYGMTTAAFEAVVAPLNPVSTWLSPDRRIGEGEVVVLRAGALRDGWEGSLARTYAVHREGASEVAPPTGWDDVLLACQAGTAVREVTERGARLHGVGRGIEPITDDDVLGAGGAYSVELQDSTGVRQDVVFVDETTTNE
jgi:Xaa-Pro aminopeptidase